MAKCFIAQEQILGRGSHVLESLPEHLCMYFVVRLMTLLVAQTIEVEWGNVCFLLE
jgi:hypothetical protein